MGNTVSAIDSSRVTRKAKKRARNRGMFNYPNGRNIQEEYSPSGANQWVTVFFNWADHKYNDEELMDLVVARINARDGIISSEPVHHDIKWCLSLRVPVYWNPSDISIAGTAKVIAQWHQSEMRHAGVKINRKYLFRGSNRRKKCHFYFHSHFWFHLSCRYTYTPLRSTMTCQGKEDTPLPYTASPIKLLWSDLSLFVSKIWALPGIFLPLHLARTHEFDEFYPSLRNGATVLVHIFLMVYQLVFLFSLPIMVICMIPGLWILTYSAIALTVNYAIVMLMLNGFQQILVSQVSVVERPGNERERWLYINGIAAGHHWVQMNIDQLSHIFGRKVTGVHNRTAGIVFDLIECLIQRDFAYATDDIRQSYALVKEALLDPECDKVVLLLHSQGGIEGGLVLDWLLDELPHDRLHHLEVYTFGNAANHFNNPRWTKLARPQRISTPDIVHQFGQSIGHIEHYANSGDIVALGGVLHFVDIPNRYMGRLFVRPNSGHLLNMHYLDNMFTLGPDMSVLDSNPFMDMEVEPWTTAGINGYDGPPHRVRYQPTITRDEAFLPAALSLQRSQTNGVGQRLRVKDFSRLWKYRNGGCPNETGTAR
ncbi:uncharacterized protein N7479_000046 [Penicillium vulpinum]|nr:uncharacterized protein N7479_000046 [Penicillium vulpinum]KAJ5970128.1 hypothetical protein N7479_000046 [Penicillium vulpinum]